MQLLRISSTKIYSFSRNTDFLDPLGFLTDIGQGERQNERQSAGTETVSSQILPVFVIAFFASLVNSLFFMNDATTTSEGKLVIYARTRVWTRMRCKRSSSLYIYGNHHNVHTMCRPY